MAEQGSFRKYKPETDDKMRVIFGHVLNYSEREIIYLENNRFRRPKKMQKTGMNSGTKTH